MKWVLFFVAVSVVAGAFPTAVNSQITDSLVHRPVMDGGYHAKDNKPLRGPHVAPQYTVMPVYDNGAVKAVSSSNPLFDVKPVYDDLDSNKVRPTGAVSKSVKSVTENANTKLYSSQNVVIEPAIPSSSKKVDEAKKLVKKIESEVVSSAEAVDGNMKPMAKIEVKKEKEQLKRAARLIDIAKSKGKPISKKLQKKLLREAKAVHMIDTKSKKKNKNKKGIKASPSSKKAKIKQLLKKVKVGVLNDAKGVDQKSKKSARKDITKEKSRLLKAAAMIDAAKLQGKNVKKLTNKIIQEAKAVHLVDRKSTKKGNKPTKTSKTGKTSGGMQKAKAMIKKIKTELLSTSREVDAKLPKSAVKREAKTEQKQVLKTAKLLDKLQRKGKDVSKLKKKLLSEAKALKAIKKGNKKNKKKKKKTQLIE